MAVEKNIKINVDAKKAISQVDELKTGVQDTNKAAANSQSGFKKMKSGIGAVGLAFKAIGVGLIVAAFAKLAEILSQNQEVMDKVNIASAVLGDIFTKIGKVIVSVVKGLGLLGKAVSKVLKGEFSEAANLAKDSFNGVKEAVVGNNKSFKDFINNAKNAAIETGKFAKELVRLRNEVKLAEANQRQLQLVYQKDAELQRQIRDDISLTFEERIAANTKLAEILDKQFAEEEALALKKVRLAELELSRNKSNIDLQVALIDAKTELADLDERITGQRSEQLTNLKALEKEQADAIQASIDADKKRAQEAEKNGNKTVDIAKKTGEAEVEIAKLTAENKRSIVANSLGQVASLIGEESKAGKALAVGQALINTYSAATAALAPPPIGAGPIFGPIAAIGAVAAGMANVKQILATKLPGGDGGGGGGGPEPAIPQAGGLGPQDINMEAIEQPTLGGQQPAQAFVVESDISNAQALQQELDLQSTL